MSSHKSAAGEVAALSAPVKAYSYRFFLSVCFLVMVSYLLALRSSASGVFVLVLLNLLFCADVMFKNAWRDLENFRVTLSVLACTCVLAAFCYGVSKTFLLSPLAGNAPDLYIALSSVIVLYLWTCSRAARSKERTKVFIKKLDDFLPKSGRLMQGRREMMVFARELKEGDIIRVKAGERIPCEGEIAKGDTAIDESLITGNMLPTAKTLGSRVYAGTLNKRAEIMVRVKKGLAESVIAGIINAIKNSERRRCVRKDPLDKYALWLLLAAVLLALAGYVYFYWLGDYRRPLHTVGIFLLVMGLSCPLSFFFAAVFPALCVRWSARRRKIILQELGALEVLSQADAVFFDKTGTLTYGELRISSVHAADGKNKKDLLECLASAEQLVDGPFAAAVNIYAQEHKIAARKLLCFDVLPGLGVKAISGKSILLAGRPEWLREQGVPVPQQSFGEQAVICGAKNGKYLGYVLLDDKLRPGAADMVRALKAMGKEVILMSGDNEASVSAIAKEAGVDKFNFGVLPQTKAEILGNFSALGKKAVMVGDGFNDITALLRADAGVVFSSGKNVYNNWVDVIIKRSDLGSITDLFSINKKLSARIRGNILLGLLCNILLLGWVLFAPASSVGAWYQVPAGILAGVFVIFLNSARLLNVK